MPVFAHLEGICHVYVDKAADLEKARAIVLNAKLRRTGICGAAETLLVDEAGAARLLQPLVSALIDAGCEVRGDEAVRAADPRAWPASEADWATEYLDAIISAKVVPGVRAAIDHIAKYGSRHTDAIVTEDAAAAETLPARSRQRHCAAQRVHAIRRWRRVRHGRRDRHRHGALPRARAGRRGAAHDLQICRARRRTDAARMTGGGWGCRPWFDRLTMRSRPIPRANAANGSRG